MTRITQKRRGVTAVLAMLYLTVMATLALGFYATTNTQSIVSENEKRSAQALSAAESGMDFIRYQLFAVRLPPGPSTKMMDQVAKQLSDHLNPTGNLDRMPMSYDPAYGLIEIPGRSTQFITLDKNGPRFHAAIRQDGEDLQVVVVGVNSGGTASRAVRMLFIKSPVDKSVFIYGVAARGKIKLGGDFDLDGEDQEVDGSLLATAVDEFKHPVEIKKKASISGDIFLADPDGKVKIHKKAEIHGTTDPREYAQYIHKGITPPEFPTVDPYLFKKYATDLYTGGHKDNDGRDYYSNVVIPAGVNPHFDKETVIEGVMYIKMPNKVSFNEHTIVRGVIVVEPSDNPKDYKDKKNTIDFHKGTTLYDVSTLPATDEFPQSMRDLSGASIIAPDTQIKFKGKSGAWAGSIISEDITFSGHSGGVISGSIISYGDTKLEGKSGLIIDRDRARGPWVGGLSLTSRFIPDPQTYDESKN